MVHLIFSCFKCPYQWLNNFKKVVSFKFQEWSILVKLNCHQISKYKSCHIPPFRNLNHGPTFLFLLTKTLTCIWGAFPLIKVDALSSSPWKAFNCRRHKKASRPMSSVFTFYASAAMWLASSTPYTHAAPTPSDSDFSKILEWKRSY